MTLEEMITYKNRMGYSNMQVAEWTGIPLGTVQKIFSGETKRPRYQTLQSLKKFFEEKAADEILSGESVKAEQSKTEERDCINRIISDGDSVYSGGMVKDSAAYAYMCHTQNPDTAAEKSRDAVSAVQEKRYTIKDYYNLPDDVRAELLDGQLFYMTAPGTIHQRVQGEIFRQIANFIDDNEGECIPFMAPTDVALDMDAYTMLEPDIFVVCDPEKLTEKWIWGAPDFVIEITSPSTRKRDFTKKLAKYEAAGVKEYWIVNLKDRNVLVYHFQEEVCPVFYPLSGEIPVGIYDGKLKIRFDRIGGWVATGSLR